MKLEIKNESLFIEKAYIDGRWVDADDKSTLEVINPVNQEIIGHVPNCGADETNVAINAAAAAQKKWQKYPAKEKASILRNFYDLLCSNQDDLAKILTYEQGKPLAEAIGEIAYSASFIEWFAEEAKRVYGDLIPGHMHDRRTLVIKQPVGVVASITPWNFPSAMLARKVGPALATGCSLVCKPAKQTPFSALAFAYLAEEAGVPKGLLNVLTGNAQTIGKALTDSEVVRKLTFTGSTEVGKMLLKECAKTVKRVSMELGGHAPFIVFEDADIEAAVEGAIAAKYRNAGQTCVCANRIYVHEDIYEEFSEGFTKEAGKLKTGQGFDPSTDQGPLIDEAALAKVEEHVADAKNHGGQITLGGQPHKLGGLFYEPTVIKGANDEMLVSYEETFGPVAPLFSFSSEEEVIERANNTPFGLASYFYTSDLAKSWRVSEQLEYGIVGLNTGIISTEMAPFGGIKESGMGREGSKYGIDDYLEIKYVSLAGIEEPL
ncbi:MAG: glutarate-semialdehyde dehydrogenase DavD [Gammaproteobacteria bacterium]|jgi:succinate-semialdehyde dehydrogenase/glutarate-semialdehyde dehydrogenase|nr:NAD-dependent succinate-semialdehyde dehydrogenase [Gammaproteobacteria bacterium]MCH2550499.1 NAD-dependent succinate-semialdehyde dehydrogenase [Alphaproteobacteria bacterium]GIT36482.1 MAG: glutarate-semialdehyde dehydrogenase DavD [Gammaproteobacteria bacterium]